MRITYNGGRPTLHAKIRGEYAAMIEHRHKQVELRGFQDPNDTELMDVEALQDYDWFHLTLTDLNGKDRGTYHATINCLLLPWQEDGWWSVENPARPNQPTKTLFSEEELALMDNIYPARFRELFAGCGKLVMIRLWGVEK